MKPERWQKIDEIFHAALQYKPEERKAFIEEACRGDEELRREIESLLAEERGADQFIEEPAMDVMAKDLADEQRDALIGKNIGPYKILSLLGAGGMGEVYRAEDSHLKRHVAVKVLASRFADDRERMARFQREAHLLASLNHPEHCSNLWTRRNQTVFEPWSWSWLKVERSLIALQLDRYRSTKRFQLPSR